MKLIDFHTKTYEISLKNINFETYCSIFFKRFFNSYLALKDYN